MAEEILHFENCSKPRLTRTDPLGLTEDRDRWRIVIKWEISWLGKELLNSQA